MRRAARARGRRVTPGGAPPARRPRRGAQGARPRPARRLLDRGPPPRRRDRRPRRHRSPATSPTASPLPLAQQALPPGLGRPAHPRRRAAARGARRRRSPPARAEAVQSLGKHRALEHLVERAERDARQQRARPRRARGAAAGGARRSSRDAKASADPGDRDPAQLRRPLVPRPHRLRVGQRAGGHDLARRDRRIDRDSARSPRPGSAAPGSARRARSRRAPSATAAPSLPQRDREAPRAARPTPPGRRPIACRGPISSAPCSPKAAADSAPVSFQPG